MKRNPGRRPYSDARMPFTGHLEELRSCLIKCFLAVMVAFAGSFAFAEIIFSFLTAPLLQLESPNLSLIGTGVPEAFFVKIKVAFVASIFVALPVILWQTWRFVAPGLYEHEKRYARGFVFFGTLFFLLGASFCYEVIFRVGYGFLLKTYETINVRPAIRIAEYLSFSSRLLLAFGIVFELPVFAYFLARIGLIDHRFLIKQFRYAILFIFGLAAILTPPDVVSQVLLALPLIALYGVSVAVAYFARRNDS
ncbi:MAG: twin-arginine translocase subunit TatC [Candidatus Binatia bacterium]